MGESPKRIQLKRVKGWKMPPNTVNVTRPSEWGNPFQIGGYFVIGDPFRSGGLTMSWCRSFAPDPKFTLIRDRAHAAEFFRRWVATWPTARLEKLRRELSGKNLACYCPADDGLPCHADILLELANPDTTP